jgi:hypothetical protein
VLVSGRDRAEVQRTLAAARALIRLDYEHVRDVAPLPTVESSQAAG